MPQTAKNKALSLNLRFETSEDRFLQVVGVDVEGNEVDGFAQIPSVAKDAVKSPVWLPKDRPDLAMAMQLYDYEQLILVVTGKNTGSLAKVYLAMQEINPSLDYSQNFEKQGKVELSFINEDEIRGTVEASKAGMLVLQTPLRAGWQLEVNGEVHELHRVNHGLMGVFLDDAGVHDISLSYRPIYWGSSFVLCLLGAFCVVLYLRFSHPLTAKLGL